MDFLTRTISSFTGPSIPYNINEEISQNQPSIWTIHEGTKKADSSPCTIWIFDAKLPANRDKLPLARNAVSKMKKLRIPGVVKILDSVETDTTLIIATERVTQLYKNVDEYSTDTKIWGLNAIINTMDHVSKNGFIHGNINMSSVCVNDCGEWLIGGLEVTTKLEEDQILYTYGGMLPGSNSNNMAPEISKGGWQAAQRNPHAIDCYQLGGLISNVFNGLNGNLNQRGKIPSQQLFNIQKQLCQLEPKQRMTITKLKQNPHYHQIFYSTMVEIEESLASLAILSQDSFSIFLDKLEETIDKFPQAYLHFKVLPQLIEAFNRNSSTTNSTNIRSMTLIIQIAKNLDENKFNTMVSPVIIKMFAMQDRAVRLELLNKLPEYIEILDKKTVSDKIFPSLATGSLDSEPVIREATVKSVMHLMPKLNDRIINGELLRMLAKTQNDQVAEIRANTTILLGRISSSFSKSTRNSVLVAAFARALKDPFVQSRIAALLALSATSEYYSAQDVCNKIIGPLAPSLVDKDSNVRQQAVVTMDTFMNKIKAEAKSMDDNSTESPTVVSKEMLSMAGMSNALNKLSNNNNSSSSNRFNIDHRTMSTPELVKPEVNNNLDLTKRAQQQQYQKEQREQQQQKLSQPVNVAQFGSMNHDSTTTSKSTFMDSAFDEDDEEEDIEDAWGQFDSDSDSNENKNSQKGGSSVLEPDDSDDPDAEWGW